MWLSVFFFFSSGEISPFANKEIEKMLEFFFPSINLTTFANFLVKI
jgi:hypothetical protein